MPSRLLNEASTSRSKTSVIFITITSFASLIILFAILYLLYHFWYTLVRRSRTSPFDSTSHLVKLQRFTYKELKTATNGFNACNAIGKGGSGSVFKGMLKDGKLVAIKLLDSNSMQTEGEFQSELRILGGIKRSPYIVCILGYCVEKTKRFVVYEYMENKSLQESLFSESNVSLDWNKRFDIILDVARALAFLHLDCDPPVIHGDVKPSNVLLDLDNRGKLSDFGLARLKLEGEFGIDMYSQDLVKSQDLWKSQDLSGNLGIVGGGGGDVETPGFSTPKSPMESHDEVDFAFSLQASTSSNNCMLVASHNVKNQVLSSLNCNENVVNESDHKGKSVVNGMGVLSVENGVKDWKKLGNFDEEPGCIDHSNEFHLSGGLIGDDNCTYGAKQWGKDWWWRQDGSGELCSKDYVMEWIGSQIYPSPSADWNEDLKCSPEKSNLDSSMPLDKLEETNETRFANPVFDGLNEGVDKGESGWKMYNKKQRKIQEWWREEHFDELSKKSKSVKDKTLESKFKKRMKVPHFSLGKHFQFKRKKPCLEGQNINDQDREFSFRRGCKKKNSPSFGSDMWSGDLFSRELSSTTSMRGTLCYIAPECGGCGYLMEKTDMYSLGVLILVIVSGRRPLHVLSSPMKLEKANLISWSRQLAQSGNILELVDEKLRDEYNKDQASLCINLALGCIQKMPELRPDIGDIVKILKGEMELPSLPFEFSPSPPSKLFSKSRRKLKSSG
ncbi:hypothetical protein Leryth_027687 [Lithospermum erythrorhizon]|nr:hypothetical protein Leryth_027687 [Lithospermum erythrorhizon]